MQTIRHREYFTTPQLESAVGEEHPAHAVDNAMIRSLPFHAAMLIGYMVPIVLLSKKLAIIIDFGIVEVGAPAAFGGLLVAVLVLAPEVITALRAALSNQLQRSINISLGSALATIGLTVPAFRSQKEGIRNALSQRHHVRGARNLVAVARGSAQALLANWAHFENRVARC